MTRGEAFRVGVGELARPFSIYISSLSASFATGAIAVGAVLREIELSGAAIYIGAVWGGVCALYWGKSWERKEEAKAAAQVEVARHSAPNPPPGGATVIAAPPAEVSVTTDSRDAPPWERA